MARVGVLSFPPPLFFFPFPFSRPPPARLVWFVGSSGERSICSRNFPPSFPFLPFPMVSALMLTRRWGWIFRPRKRPEDPVFFLSPSPFLPLYRRGRRRCRDRRVFFSPNANLMRATTMAITALRQQRDRDRFRSPSPLFFSPQIQDQKDITPSRGSRPAISFSTALDKPEVIDDPGEHPRSKRSPRLCSSTSPPFSFSSLLFFPAMISARLGVMTIPPFPLFFLPLLVPLVADG